MATLQALAVEATPALRARRWWLFQKRILPIALTYMGLVPAPFCFSVSGIVVAVWLLVLTGLGVTVGLHRLLTHRSFSTYQWLERALATLGALAFQGGVVDWIAIHRMHHAHSDTEGDPHTPKESFWRGHFLWLFRYDPRVAEDSLKARYVKDVCQDPYMTFLEDWSICLQVLLFVVLYVFGEIVGPGLGLSWSVYGVFVRAAVLQQIAWLVNSASHTWGYRSYETRDRSVNCWWLALPSLGEGWHNNHHSFPRSARFGLRWYELDLGFVAIRVLQTLHLAWDMVSPLPESKTPTGLLLRAKSSMLCQRPTPLVTATDTSIAAASPDRS
jgi:fatty-acid desaturase